MQEDRLVSNPRTEVPSVRNTPAVIAYADKANERHRRRYYKMVLNKYKKHNVAKTAIAKELACFMWHDDR